MKKFNKLHFIVLFLISFFNSIALQSQSFQWAKSGGSTDDWREQIEHIVTDAQGNVYGTALVGRDNLQVDGIPKTINSQIFQNNSLLVSFTCDGSFRWSKYISGIGSHIKGLVIDSQANIYVTGNAINTDYLAMQFDVDLIRPLASGSYPNFANSQVFFIAKYATNGALQWVKYPEPNNVKAYSYTNLGSGRALGMQNDNDGNLYILALLHKGVYANGQYVNNLNGTQPWAEDQLANNIGQSHHILKYDTMGNFVSGFSIGLDFSWQTYTTLNDPVFGKKIISYDFVRNKNNGSFYLATRNNYYTQYPPLLINDEPLTQYKILIAYNAQGQFLWKKTNSSTLSYGTKPKIALDDNGNIYWCDGTVFYNPISNIGQDAFANQLITTTSEIDFYTMHPYVAKLNPNGDLLWLKHAEKQISFVQEKSITVNGNEVAIGDSSQYAYWENREFDGLNFNNLDIIRLNKDTGALINIDTAPVNNTNVSAQPACITADAIGNYYLGGFYDTPLTVGSTTINSSGGTSDFFIAKFGTNNCNCQVPTCRFIENTLDGNTVNFVYQGQAVYNTVSWNFNDGTPTSNQVNTEHTYATQGIYNVCVTATNSCDSYTFCKLVDTATLGTGGFIESISANLEISPNPASEKTTISFESASKIPTLEFYDIAGRLINHYEPTTTKGTWSIPLTGLSSGVYYVILKQSGVITMQKKLLVH